MKKFLYLTMAPIDESSGVYKKIISQVDAFYRLGYEGKVLFIRDTATAYLRSIDGSIIDLDLNNKEIKEELSRYMTSCEFCYARFELLRHSYYRKMIILCNKLRLKIVSEIPTYPPHQESIARVKESWTRGRYYSALKTLLGTLIVIMDMYIMTFYSKMMVVIADNKKFLLSKTIRIENGIDIKKNPFNAKEGNETINIIAVSNFSVWNGYDRAIVGLANYVNRHKDCNIHITMVGDKTAGSSLIQQTKELGIEKYVTFTGALAGKDLNNAYANADIALGALGNHRRKVFANSSLKAKEYASRGMLMILADSEGIEYEILEKSFIVRSNENPIDFEQVLIWYQKLNNKTQLKNYIHTFAINHYVWDVQIDKVIKQIERL